MERKWFSVSSLFTQTTYVGTNIAMTLDHVWAVSEEEAKGTIYNKYILKYSPSDRWVVQFLVFDNPTENPA